MVPRGPCPRARPALLFRPQVHSEGQTSPAGLPFSLLPLRDFIHHPPSKPEPAGPGLPLWLQGGSFQAEGQQTQREVVQDREGLAQQEEAEQQTQQMALRAGGRKATGPRACETRGGRETR